MDSIKKYRGQLGLTQEQLAKKIGVARILVTYWEKDNCQGLSLQNAQKLSKVFNCSLLQLYGINNFKKPPQDDNDRILLIKLLLKSMEDKKLKGDLLKCLQQKK